ncbi:MAG: leucine-rich repeat protein [Clostridia bacterium]|nr:leucine-rich repeat protein [Clostridia bacterium]
MKKVLCIVLTLAMLVSLFSAMPVTASALDVTGSCGDNVTYTIDAQGNLTLSGTGATYNYTESNPSPFYQSAAIKSVTVESGITALGDYLFSGCSAMTIAFVIEDVQTIGGSAFINCTALKEIYIGYKVLSIESRAFYNCSALEDVYYDGNQTSWDAIQIGSDNEPLLNAKINFPIIYGKCGENVNYALDGYGNLTLSGTGATYDYDDVSNHSPFSDDVRIKSVTVESGITALGAYLFQDCTAITSVELPNTLTSIGESAFNYCKELESVTIPDSVTGIGYCAFLNCYALSELSIGSGVTSIGDMAFAYCRGLASIQVAAGNSTFDSRGNCNAIIRKSGDVLIQGCKNTVIPEDVQTIGNYAFANMSALESITIPESVTAIQMSAFFYCSNLKSIAIPNAVQTIGDRVFMNCSNLKEVTIGRGVTSIVSMAFYNCNALEEVYYEGAAADWDKIEIGTYNEPLLNAQRHYSLISGSCGENVTYTIDAQGNLTLSGTGATYDYDTGSNPSPFYTSNEIKTLTVERGVSALGENLFYGCSSLKSVQLPQTLKTIGYHAFFDCSRLESLTIPDSVSTIGGGAFARCENLSALSVGSGVSSIGEMAFSDCRNLESIRVAVGNSVFDSRDNCNAIIRKSDGLLIQGCNNTVIPEGVLAIGSYAFSGMSGLENITIPESVCAIYAYAFAGCDNLATIRIPDAVTTIYAYAFRKCYALESVTIANGVREICSAAFYNCDALADVYYEGTAVDWGKMEIAVFNDPLLNAQRHYSAQVVATGTCGPDVTYTLDSEGRLRLSGTGATYDYDDDANLSPFSNDGRIKSVTVDSGITALGKYLCFECTAITSVNFPNTLSAIGDSAFEYCKSIESLTIPDSVTGIGIYTFMNCYAISELSIGSGLTSIGELAFAHCKGLSSIRVAADNATFDSRGNCNAIIRKNGDVLIQGCKNTVIPEDVRTIGRYAFSNISGLQSLTIPESVTAIKEFAFFGCSNLTNVDIPNAVQRIGEGAFMNCSELKEISIGSGVASIEDKAFYHCDALEDVYYDGTAADWGKIEIGTNNEPLLNARLHYSAQVVAMGSCGPDVTYTLDSEGRLRLSGTGATYDYNNSSNHTPFYSDAQIKSVKIDSGITALGEYLFANCAAIKSAQLPNTLTDIGMSAFFYCKGLQSITIPDSITNIGDSAFICCYDLADLFIGRGVTDIGDMAFGYCSALSDIRVAAGNSVYDSRGNCNAIIRKSDDTLILGCKTTGIPQGIRTIGNNAFYGMSELESITIPESVTSLEKYAFFNCENLKSIAIPDAIQTIGFGAFMYCSALKEISIGSGVTNIVNNAFYNCSALEDVYYKGSSADWGNIAIGVNNDPLLATTMHYNSNKTIRYTVPAFEGKETTLTLKSNTATFDITAVNGTFVREMVPSGAYKVFAKQKHSLRRKIDDYYTFVDEKVNLDTIVLPLGDVTDDDLIDVWDIARLLRNDVYGTKNADFDLNGDGMVDFADVSVALSSQSYGQHSDEIA